MSTQATPKDLETSLAAMSSPVLPLLPSVAVCVITYNRPVGLARLLDGLAALKFEAASTPQIEVVVVDNGCEGDAYQVCLQRQDGYPWPLKCSIESQRGISFARNSAVAQVSPGTDFIAFIDDDEVPSPRWLAQLVQVQQKTGADVVQGPVLPRFNEQVPAWIVEGGVFLPPQRETGDRLAVAYTHNVLVRSKLLTCQPEPFQPRFALTGGEDSYFFRGLHHNDHSIVWAAEALVEEWIPASRTCAKWLIQRNYRSCLTYCLWEKDYHPALKDRLWSCTKAMASILQGLLRLPLALLQGRHHQVQALIDIARGLGRLAGQLNWTYQEYKTIHSSSSRSSL